MHCGSAREGRLAAHLARGRNSAFIQKELFITNNTVKAHVKHIYQKLGVSSHQELIDLVDGEKR
ncbi:response regulator transcription factor [Raoultibacter phocaeensis]|uniref:response regulator transcription factor n=1 Tax=Raoultibacter phocaeensis TaxID=2479841 RepID=UPI00111B120A|nr:helix-turn-helix transcriptional regulator [Raoultibacter phocaeensis]